MPSLKPIRNKILVTPYRRKRTRSGGIMLTEEMRNILMGDDHCFWVVAVADGIEDVKVKDRVILQQDHDGLEYLTDGSKRAFVKLEQVLLVIGPDFQSPPISG